MFSLIGAFCKSSAPAFSLCCYAVSLSVSFFSFCLSRIVLGEWMWTAADSSRCLILLADKTCLLSVLKSRCALWLAVCTCGCHALLSATTDRIYTVWRKENILSGCSYVQPNPFPPPHTLMGVFFIYFFLLWSCNTGVLQASLKA